MPECCCRIVGYSEEYKEPFVCNFLGLSVGVQLPAHVIASDQHVLLDILPPLKRQGGGGGGKLSREEVKSRQQLVMVEGESGRDPLKDYKLMVYTAQPRAPEQRSEPNSMTSCRWNVRDDSLTLIEHYFFSFSSCVPSEIGFIVVK